MTLAEMALCQKWHGLRLFGSLAPIPFPGSTPIARETVRVWPHIHPHQEKGGLRGLGGTKKTTLQPEEAYKWRVVRLGREIGKPVLPLSDFYSLLLPVACPGPRMAQAEPMWALGGGRNV